MAWEPFDLYTDDYDAWFDGPVGSQVFGLEVEALAGLVGEGWVEVGVGTGRFARALGLPMGIDPSRSVLDLAKARGLEVVQASGEALPLADSSVPGLLMVVTVCFLDDPVAVLAECARVLRPGGRLVVGFVPRDGDWGRLYRDKAREGHRFYRVARFYSCDRVYAMGEAAGLVRGRARSCLFTPPGVPVSREISLRADDRAGFVALELVKEG